MAVMVEITRSTVLEPSLESARGGGKKILLTVFDRASTDDYIPVVIAWNAPAPTYNALKDGLITAAARFPHLAGRFATDDHGQKCFHLNDAGVLVVEATADAHLAEALAHINELYPKAENVRDSIFARQNKTCTRNISVIIVDAVALVDDEYIQSFIDFGEAERGGIENGGGEELASTAATPGMVFCPDLEVDSWLGFRFHDLDFGCGPPCAFLPPDLPIDGIMIFVPFGDAKGGVDLFMALDHDNVEAFKQICYSMD